MDPRKFLVSKEFSFDAGHQLVGHNGKCRNVHGHTYKVIVKLEGNTIQSAGDSSDGFVIDFSDLKELVKTNIIDRMDHAFIAQGNEPILKTLVDTGCKVYLLGNRSTAENIAKHIYWKIQDQLHELPIDAGVYSVQVFETPTSCAEYGDWE